MTVCAMFGCKNRMRKGSGKHFFRFPMKDPERLVQWIEAVQRDDWKPSVHSKVCSDHFTEKDYKVRPGAACPYLQRDAVPMPLLRQCKKKTKRRKTIKTAADDTPGTKEEEDQGDMMGEEDQCDSRAYAAQGDHQEVIIVQDAAAPEPPTQDPAAEPEISEITIVIEDEDQGAEMVITQEKVPEVQTHEDAQAIEIVISRGKGKEVQTPGAAQAAEIAISQAKGTEVQTAGAAQTAEMVISQGKGTEVQTAGAAQAAEMVISQGKGTEAQTAGAAQAAEMDIRQGIGPEGVTHGAAQTAEVVRTQGKGPEVQTQVAVTWGQQLQISRMADATTQSERQVALILAELEDTHCEMRAAEARAAAEAASANNQSSGDTTADCSDNKSSEDNLENYVPFDHSYTSLTMNGKENNAPPPAITPASTPSPVTNPKLFKLRKKIKALQKQVLRQGAKVKSLKQTLVDLRQNNLLEKDPERVISQHCSGLALALFTTQLKNHRKYSAMQYCNLLKDFALSLYSASPKAYKFCRLFLSLPHPVSLRHWKTTHDASQGALQEVIMQAEQGEDLQGQATHEDILAGALHAVSLHTDEDA